MGTRIIIHRPFQSYPPPLLYFLHEIIFIHLDISDFITYTLASEELVCHIEYPSVSLRA